MKKYGTPEQKKINKAMGLVKISAEKLKSCCFELLKNLKIGEEADCSCGNKLTLEKLDV